MQVDGRERGTDWTALRRPFVHANDDALLHHAGPESLSNEAQNDRVGDAVGHHLAQPFVIDVVEVAADVRLVHVPHLPRHEVASKRTERLVRVASGAKAPRGPAR